MMCAVMAVRHMVVVMEVVVMMVHIVMVAMMMPDGVRLCDGWHESECTDRECRGEEFGPHGSSSWN